MEQCNTDLCPNYINIEFAKVQSNILNNNNNNDISDDLFHFPSTNWNEENSQHLFEFKMVDEVEVVEAVLKIKSSAIGFDSIHPLFIKIILPFILPVLTHIFNSIILTSSFPNTWKIAKVIPVPKKTETHSSPKEFRPISILSFLSKILEKLLHKQINNFLKTNKLLTDCQSGFRQGHSCVTATLKISEDVRKAIDEDLVTFLVLLDFSKAFDTVNHRRLILKLKHQYHFSDAAANLILSYLAGRSQAVVIDDRISHPLNLLSGVPQGSILGPLLFSMFINDLPIQVKHSNIDLYADDAQVKLSCKLGMIEDGANKLNSDLSRILAWSKTNGLNLNPKKSKCLIIYKTPLNQDYFPSLFLGKEKIDYVSKAKNLGIIFNSTLTWDDHIRMVISKIYASLRSLSLSKHFLPQHIRLRLAKTLIVPIITYGCQIYISHNSILRSKLTVAFNNVTRYVYGLKRFDHISNFSSNILGCNLYTYLEYLCLKTLNKIIMNKTPNYLFKNINFASSYRSFMILQPRFSCRISENQFFIYVIRQWNKLPISIRKQRGTFQFEAELLRFLAIK